MTFNITTAKKRTTKVQVFDASGFLLEQYKLSLIIMLFVFSAASTGKNFFFESALKLSRQSLLCLSIQSDRLLLKIDSSKFSSTQSQIAKQRDYVSISSSSNLLASQTLSKKLYYNSNILNLAYCSLKNHSITVSRWSIVEFTRSSFYKSFAKIFSLLKNWLLIALWVFSSPRYFVIVCFDLSII